MTLHRRRRPLHLLLVGAILLVAWLLAPGAAPATAGGRVALIALDGVSAEQLQAWIDAGWVPAIAAVREAGGVARLEPGAPASEEALWTTFACGRGPGTHGVYDFTVPDFATPRPRLADLELEPPRFRWRYWLAAPPRASRRRLAPPFWRALDDAGHRVTLLFVPMSFPPDPLPHLRQVAGLGTPDLAGSRGTFTVLTSREDIEGEQQVPGGRVVRLREEEQGHSLLGTLAGPLDHRGDGPPQRLTAPVKLRRDPGGHAVHIALGKHRQTVRRGEWSRPLPVAFAYSPFYKVHGLTRAYVRSVEPLSVYFAPVGIDPQQPFLPFTQPPGLAAELAGAVGDFTTVGWAHDTFAATLGVLGRQPFLEAVERTLGERAAILEHELERRDWELLVAVFTAFDRVSHVAGGLGIDLQAGAAARAGQQPQPPVQAELARRFDALIGAAAKHLAPGDLLLVVSTHGLAPYERGLSLNTWLALEGYLAFERVEPAADPETIRHALAGAGPFAGVDWSRSRAYALGNGQLYLNRRGREAQGIVEPREVAALSTELAERLRALRDPRNNARPVARVLRGSEIFQGAAAAAAPDLVVQLRPGYAIAFGSLIGGVPRTTFQDNTTRWRAEHAATESARIAGFVLANRPLAGGGKQPARVEDLAATLAAELGMDPAAAGLAGTPLVTPR